jgi:hypothetical protein
VGNGSVVKLLPPRQKKSVRVFNFIQTPIVDGRSYFEVERCRKATGLSIQLTRREPFRVPVTLALKLVG